MTDKNAQALEAAAKKLAEVFDYPWEHMPEQGRENMRKNVRAVIAALESTAPAMSLDDLPPAGRWLRGTDGFVVFAESGAVPVTDGERLYTHSQIVRDLAAAPSAAEPVAWPTLTNEMVYHAQDEFHILPPRMQRLWSRLSEFHVAPPAPSATSADPTVMDEKGELEALNNMRLSLIVAIHSLASDFENASGALDPEARRAVEGSIRHARDVAARWNYNGPLRATLPAAQPEADPDPADIIAGALQTSRAHAMELMRAAVQPEAETSAEKAAGLTVPDECPHLIWFDDQDCKPLMFSGSGARAAALHKFKEVSLAWNAHLFVRVANNCRDDRFIAFNARLATPADAPVAEPVALTDDEIDAVAGRFEARRWVFEFGDVSPVGEGKVTMCEFNARQLRHFARAISATHPPAPEEGKDAALLDWLETKVVNVREPLMHGSLNLFWASPDQDDPAFPAGPSDIRAKVRAAMAQGERG